METNYRVPADNSVCEFIEKKSRFITYLAHVTSEQEATDFINKIRKKHSDATHNCIAYRLYNPRIERFSDDGEPSGTAGMPMLEVLKKEDIYDVCVVVTRYFGGVLLGAGGLVRAYGKGVSDALASAGFAVREMGVTFTLSFAYQWFDRVQKYLETLSHIRIGCDFGENVVMTLTIKEADFDTFKLKVTDMLQGKAQFCELSRDFDSFK